MTNQESMFHRMWRHTRNKLIAGLVVIIPLLSTLFIFQWVFNFWDQFLNRPIVREYKEYYFPGLGIILSLIVIYVVGLGVTNYLGSRVFGRLERLIVKIPFVRGIYNAIKQVVTTVTAPNKNAFKKVVVVEYPTKGIKMLGFLTSIFFGSDGKEYSTVFIPTTPNPTSGYLAVYPKEEVLSTEIPVEDGMKMIVSGGILASEKLSGYMKP